MLFIILPKTRRHPWLRWLCNNISLENGFGKRSNESLLFYTYIALKYIYRGLKYIHKGSQHAPILDWQLTVVQRESKTWINGTGEGNHVENIYSEDVTITIYGLVPDYVVDRLTSCRWKKNSTLGLFFQSQCPLGLTLFSLSMTHCLSESCLYTFPLPCWPQLVSWLCMNPSKSLTVSWKS